MYRPLLLACLTLAVPVFAQSPRLETRTDVGVRVTQWVITQSPVTTLKSIPPKTIIKGTQSVEAKFVAGYARTEMTAAQQGLTGTYVIRESADVNGPAHYTHYYASTATKTIDRPHAWLIHVPANPKGNELVLDVTTKGLTKTASVAIDIGDDLQVELTHTMSGGNLTKTFQLGTKATVVRVETYALIQTQKWRATYDFTVGLTLNKDDPVAFKSYGPACGMQLSMQDTVTGSGHNITADARGGFPLSPVLLLLGAQKANVRFPGTNCTVLVQSLGTVGLTADNTGQAKLAITVPGRMSGTIYVQALSLYGKFGLTNFRFSNGVHADAGN